MRGVRASNGRHGSTGISRSLRPLPGLFFLPYLICFAGGMLVLGCREKSEAPKGRELDTVEVPSAIDDGISLADDVEAKPVGKRTTGVVPSDFPESFPIYSPSAVVDFGPGFVALTSTDPVGEVRQGIAAAAAASGWQTEAAGRYRKAGRRVAVSFGSISGVTTIRLDYS